MASGCAGYLTAVPQAPGHCGRKGNTMTDKLTVALACLSIALIIGLGVVTHQLIEARQVIDKQERQLKELYGQVNELTLQYVDLVKRLKK